MSTCGNHCAAKLERIGGQLEVIRRKIDGLARIVTDGADRMYPWFKLKPARRKLVEDVFNCLREDRALTVRRDFSEEKKRLVGLWERNIWPYICIVQQT